MMEEWFWSEAAGHDVEVRVSYFELVAPFNDEIFVLFGAAKLVILNPKKEDSSHLFVLIGENIEFLILENAGFYIWHLKISVNIYFYIFLKLNE